MEAEFEDPVAEMCRKRVGLTLSEKWRLDQMIGVGGMAAVYAATHRNGARSAIKVLHPELSAMAEFRNRFLKEAYIANMINHPGVVKVLDDDKDDQGVPYIIMELLTGETVDSRARRAGGTLPLNDVLKIADKTLAVLEAAHAVEIVHRDLKPENLFITDEGALKVLDFGIARMKHQLSGKRTQTGVLMGTPEFMPPEQALGRQAQIGPRTDLWAVGAIMFSLLSNKCVHEGETSNEIIVSAATNPPRSLARVLPDAPVELVRYVDRALQFDPAQRFQDATAMRTELRAMVRAGVKGNVTFVATAAATAATVLQVSAVSSSPARAVRAGGLGRGKKDAEGKTREYDVDILNLAAEATADDVQLMTDMFRAMELGLTARSQYGADHPEADRRIQAAVAHAVQAAAGSSGGLVWNVTPYSFEAGGHSLWEPERPYDRIPYQLFSDGIRALGFLPGMRDEEFIKFLEVVSMDPAVDMSPEDDFATLLWDADFESIVHFAIDAFAEGDQAERTAFQKDKDKVIQLAKFDTGNMVEQCWQAAGGGAGTDTVTDRKSQLLAFIMSGGVSDKEAAALAGRIQRSLDGDGNDIISRDTLGIDPDQRTLLTARLEPDTVELSRRFALVVADGFTSWAGRGKGKAVAEPIRLAVDALALKAPIGALELIKAFCTAVNIEGQPEETEKVRAALAGSIVSIKVMRAVLSSVVNREGGETAWMEGLTMILGYVDNTHVPEVLRVLPTTKDPNLHELFMAYIRRAAEGSEAAFGEVLPDLDVDLGLAVLRILVGLGTPEAREAIQRALANPHPFVRIEALSTLEGANSVKIRQELTSLLSDKDSQVRVSTMKAMEKYQLRAAGPFLVLQVKAGDFHGLPPLEKEQALRTIYSLAPTRAEQVTLEIVEEGKLMRSGSFEETRVIAANILSESSSSPMVAQGLEKVMKSKLKSSQKVRDAASQALEQVKRRMTARIAAKGDKKI
jgi:hypothetical protein